MTVSSKIGSTAAAIIVAGAVIGATASPAFALSVWPDGAGAWGSSRESVPGQPEGAQGAQALQSQGPVYRATIPGVSSDPLPEETWRGRQPSEFVTEQPAPTRAPATPRRTTNCPLMIEQALGTAGCMISFCESSWNPNATGPAGERGWFQVHPRYHSDATYDPAGNIAAAIRISRGGTDWRAWSVRTVLYTGVCPSGVRYPG